MLVLATFGPQQIVPQRFEFQAGLFAGGAEGVLHRASGVSLPVAILVRPICPRTIEYRLGDLLAGVASHSHSDRDIGVEPRGIDATGAWLFTQYLLDVPAIDRCRHQRLPARPDARRVRIRAHLVAGSVGAGPRLPLQGRDWRS